MANTIVNGYAPTKEKENEVYEKLGRKIEKIPKYDLREKGKFTWSQREKKVYTKKVTEIVKI